jgi:Flp pilus assembly pilin Flp
MRRARSRHQLLATLLDDSSGAAATEYIVLVGTVALGSAVAFIAVGVALVRDFTVVRNLLLGQFP